MESIERVVSKIVKRAIAVNLSLEEVRKLRLIQAKYKAPSFAHTLRLMVNEKYAILTNLKREIKSGTSGK